MSEKNIRRVRRGAKTKARHKNVASLTRLVVHRTLSHIYAQVVVRAEQGDKVLVSASTLDKALRSTLQGNKIEQAQQVGKLLGQRAHENNIADVAFDRNGYKYHGRVKALAEAVRSAEITI